MSYVLYALCACGLCIMSHVYVCMCVCVDFACCVYVCACIYIYMHVVHITCVNVCICNIVHTCSICLHVCALVYPLSTLLLPFPFTRYSSLVAQYAAVSYGDPLFSSYLLLPLQQRFSLLFRRCLWDEQPTVLRVLSLPLQQVGMFPWQ